MGTFLQTIVAFIAALGPLILIHELGHYLVARRCGVKVLRFSIGFGRPLVKWRSGPDGTEWVLAMIPLGGYVRMADEREGQVSPDEVHRTFNRQSVWRRIAIVAAGPLANFALAILLYWFLFMHGMPGLKPVIDAPPAGTSAAEAGLRGGDVIVRVGSAPIGTWQDLRWALLQQAVDRARFTVQVRDEGGALAERSVDFSWITRQDLDGDFLRPAGFLRFQPQLRPVIGQVVPGGVAARAGFQSGDEVLAIDGVEVRHWQDLVEEIRASPGKSRAFVLRRTGAELPPVLVVPDAATENGVAIGRIGIAPRVDADAAAQVMTTVQLPPGAGMLRAIERTWETSVFSVRMLGKMLIGEISVKNLSGPITIADYASKSAQLGLVTFVSFIALISITIGVLNLLPVPMLDGGQLLYYSIEILQGRPLSDRTMLVGQNLGLAVLFVLMLLAIYNDINRLIGG